MKHPSPSKDVLDEVVDVRRHLHRNPEVAFQERETSTFLRDRLQQLGLTMVDCPTETGAVASLDTGKPGRTVLLRADIDALPILEDSGVDFASGREGRMHACGHDAHTAILLGAARTLAERAETLSGKYVFLFQPAEEIVSGAKEMLARLSSMLPVNVRGMWIGTFHGLCNRFLRAHYKLANLPQSFQILDTQDPKPAGLRIAVVGGGCSGFSYSMSFENTPNMLDKTYNFDGLKVFIDQASMLYLDGAEVDFVETLEGSGFKFNNPNVKSTCGCGSSFSA